MGKPSLEKVLGLPEVPPKERQKLEAALPKPRIQLHWEYPAPKPIDWDVIVSVGTILLIIVCVLIFAHQ